ncbi:hypothetical protein C4K04_4623 [Pseudomonas chlororaphis]|uniref:Uncharacterized protein n=1 Tax=Pseudomonas chlororaphis TaxID=587753 RepID=A0A3G7TV51_9PSED|nr:hypothetical protein C4K04_4623 [Pseudomonas chlororaphis]
MDLLYTTFQSVCKPDFLHFSSIVLMPGYCKKPAWLVS